MIDGVDLQAKDYKQVFLKVVDRVKFLSNSHTVKVILVSSEGSVMPLILYNTAHKKNIIYIYIYILNSLHKT